MISRATDYIGKVIISDPTEVQDKCTEIGIQYFKGLVFCTVLEIGFKEKDLVPCRYGLSLPYLKVKENWELLIHPTIIDSYGLPERWFYTGIVDCGGTDETIEPVSDDRGIIKFDEGIYLIQIADSYIKIDISDTDNPEIGLYTSATGVITIGKEEITHLVNASGKIAAKTSGVELGGASEAMVLGDTLSTFLSNLVTNINTNYGLISTGIAGVGGTYTPQSATAPDGSELSTKHKLD
jgi:hypothetical protein